MARGRKPKGLGDTIEQITEATGIKTVVEKVSELTGINCGCEERKELLNKIWTYRQPNCLSVESIEWLSTFLPNRPEQLTIKIQERLKIIYKEVFSIDFMTTSCGSCWRDMIREIERVYEVQTNEK
jgi:hypothetical protein